MPVPGAQDPHQVPRYGEVPGPTSYPDLLGRYWADRHKSGRQRQLRLPIWPDMYRKYSVAQLIPMFGDFRK
jgi:hypothetical protein